jgi:hypothetical protein
MVTTGTQTPLAQVLSAAQRLPHAPQFRGLSPRVTHWVPQSVLPLAQVAWQVPLRQTWPVAQTVPQAPQFRVSLVKLTHAPAQELVPSGHAHTPAVQVAPAGQTVGQLPQWPSSSARFTSHPSLATPLQSAKPAAQVKPHAPAAQVGVALAREGQTLPHIPQPVTLVAVLVSQPLAASPSQLPKPVLQAPTPHAPAVHVAVPLAVTQARSQAPQCAGALRVSTSQPLEATPSQSAKPSSQA